MSGVSNWLKQQRKVVLQDLASFVGLEIPDDMKKTEVEVVLEEFLVKNASHLANEARLRPFYESYQRRAGGSPVKREPSSVVSVIERKSVRRRTRMADEISEVNETQTDDSESGQTPTYSTAIARTPRTSALALAQRVPLPPSPSVVADVIDRRTAVLRSQVDKYYKESGITETVEATRETVSSVVALEFIMLLSEALQLQPELLTNKFLFTIPAMSILNTSDYAVKVPDLFLLLTASFWGPFTLWLCTSLLVPLFGAYFFNLTSKPSTRFQSRYSFDPLTFNIVKGLLTFVIYGQDATFGGLVDLECVARINSALYRGYHSVLVGTGVGILVTMYDAVIKR